MSVVKDGVRQVGWEQRIYWRNPASASFTFGFPLVFLVVFMAINGNARIHLEHTTVKFAQYYVPAIIAFGLISACYTNLAFTISIRRDNGLLKRTRGTPLSPVAYLGGIIGNVLVVGVILCGLVLALGLVVYGVVWQDRYAAITATVVVASFTFSTLGIMVSTFVPNEDAAPAIINFVLFPLLFISGTFGQIADDSVIGRIAAVFPVRGLIRSMVAVFDPGVSGAGLRWGDLGVMLLWGFIGLGVSLVRFRWEPNR